MDAEAAGPPAAAEDESLEQRASEACHEPVLEAWTELGNALERQVLQPLEEGIRQHGEVIEGIGLAGEPPEAWHERSERLLEYRRALSSALLEPLVEAYASSGPSATIRAAATGALEACATAVGALPESVRAPFPPEALAPSPDDGLRRRVGKPIARLFSAARHTDRERDLPVRDVAHRHLLRVVAPAADELAVAASRSVAEWSGRLEAALVEWSDQALSLLVVAEQPDLEETSEHWSALNAAATKLHTELETLAAAFPSAFDPTQAAERLAPAERSLRADLALAGSFLLRPEPPKTTAVPLPKAERISSAMTEWDEGVGARARLGVAILGILAGATAVQRRLVWRFREQCLGGVEGLTSVADALEALAAPLTRGALDAAEIGTLDGAVARALQPTAEALPPAAAIDAHVSESSSSAVEALLAMIRQAPTQLTLHAEGASPPTGSRPVDTRTVALQDLARQSFDAVRIERIRSSTEGLISGVASLRDDLAALPDVFAFARDEALRELEDAEGDGQAKAFELISEALRGLAGSIRTELREIDEAVVRAQGRLAEEISAGSLALLDRVVAGRMQARLLAASSRFADLRGWATERLGPPLARLRRMLARQAGALQRLGARLLRRGEALVGTGQVSQEDSARTIRTLADSNGVISSLPLVYQRLFTLDPLSDPALVAGRSVPVGAALAQWSQWRTGEGVPLVVKGRPGSGITSVLNAVAAGIEAEGGKVIRVTLDERISDEARLAELVATALELTPDGSLGQMAAELLEGKGHGPQRAVAVDNLEHVYLRTPGGTALVERLLTFMAETEPTLFWIGGVTASAWQVIEAAEPTAVSQIEVVDLPPLGPGEMREAITVRHRRSGLPVRFEEPAKGRRLLRQRLRRMRDPAAYEELLATDFFDRLHRTSQGHLRLAIFQWLRSVDFGTGDGVEMRPPPRPDFSLLDSLSLTQNFTLKAFLEHRTLTLAEHDQIFRLPRQESYQIFESLGNRHLLEAVSRATGNGPARSEIEEGLRYRIRPLLVGAVLGHLRDRNIVH